MDDSRRRAGRAVMAAAVVAGLAGLGVAGQAGAVVAASRAVPAAGSWGTAIEVPGPGTLNAGGYAEVFSVSCGAAGDCAAGGEYQDGSGHTQGFVASERNGRWGTAIPVPGLPTLNTGGGARVGSVSCASAGNCAAGGTYADRSLHFPGFPNSILFQGFVVSERNGRWGKAIKVPGLLALSARGDAGVGSVSCGSAGTARPAGTSPTVTTPITARASSPPSGTAAGARPSRYPACQP